MTENLKQLCEQLLNTSESSVMNRDQLFNKAQSLARACLVMAEALEYLPHNPFQYSYNCPLDAADKVKNAIKKANAIAREESE